MPSDETPRRLVIVAGTGRSGTSTVAGILRRLGLQVPPPEVMTDASNPRGFGEPQWVVDFHDELLGRANVQVSDARPGAWEATGAFAHRPARERLTRWLARQYAAADGLVVKDPRISWFLPVWNLAAQACDINPSFVTMLRPPAEVVGSKRTQYNKSLPDSHGVAAWVNMMLNTERVTRGSARRFVRYHDLLDGWEPVVDSLTTHLGLRELAVDDAAREDINGFVDPTLRRISLTWDDLDIPDRLATLARGVWEGLDALADAPVGVAGVRDRLDELKVDYDAFYRESELVARSSVVAARDEARRRHAVPPPPPSGRKRIALAVVRRTPPAVRRLVPEAARAQVLARLRRR